MDHEERVFGLVQSSSLTSDPPCLNKEERNA